LRDVTQHFRKDGGGILLSKDGVCVHQKCLLGAWDLRSLKLPELEAEKKGWYSKCPGPNKNGSVVKKTGKKVVFLSKREKRHLDLKATEPAGGLVQGGLTRGGGMGGRENFLGSKKRIRR